MATVPQYQLPSISVQPLKPPYQDASAGANAIQSTGQVGKAVERAGGTLMDSANMLANRAIQMQQEDNDLAQKQGELTLAERSRAMLFDPDTGFYQKQGKEAVDAFPNVGKEMTKLQNEIAASMPNDVARRNFELAAGQRMSSELETASRFVAKARTDYAIVQSAARVESIIQDGAANFSNPTGRESSYRMGLNEVLSSPALRGAPETAVALATREFASKFHASVVDQFRAAGDPLAAKNYFNEKSGEIDGLSQAKILLTLKPEVDEAIGMQLAADISSEIVSDNNQPIQDIAVLANESGVSELDALTVMEIESSGGTASDNVGQVTPGTAAGVGISEAELNTPEGSRKAMVRVLAKSRDLAGKTLGRAPEPWEAYLVYQQGEGGGPALLKADPSMDAVDVLTPIYGDVQTATDAIAKNGGTADMTVGEFLGAWRDHYTVKQEQATTRMRNADAINLVKAEARINNSNASPEQKAIAKRQLNQQAADVKQRSELEYKMRSETTLGLVLKGADPSQLDLGWMKPEDVESLTNIYNGNSAKGTEEGKLAYTQMLLWARSDDPQDQARFAKGMSDPLFIATNFTDSQISSLMSQLDAVQKSKPDHVKQAMETGAGQINTFLDIFKLKPNESDDDAKQYYRIQGRLIEAFTVAVEANGGQPLNSKQVYDLVDTTLREYSLNEASTVTATVGGIPPWARNGKTTAPQWPVVGFKGRGYDITMANIDPRLMPKLREAVAAYGMPDTDASILLVYSQMLKDAESKEAKAKMDEIRGFAPPPVTTVGRSPGYKTPTPAPAPVAAAAPVPAPVAAPAPAPVAAAAPVPAPVAAPVAAAKKSAFDISQRRRDIPAAPAAAPVAAPTNPPSNFKRGEPVAGKKPDIKVSATKKTKPHVDGDHVNIPLLSMTGTTGTPMLQVSISEGLRPDEMTAEPTEDQTRQELLVERSIVNAEIDELMILYKQARSQKIRKLAEAELIRMGEI